MHADGSERTQHNGDQRADKSQFQRQKQGTHKGSVAEHGAVPVQGKAFKDQVIIVGIKGVADHHKDRQV